MQFGHGARIDGTASALTEAARETGEKNMKKFLLGTVGLLALGAAAPALAADLPARTYTKAPPVVAAAVYDWSGFYIGINGGWGQSRDRRTFDPTGALVGSYDANGGVVGGQVGYRWQSAGWVFGLEAQGDWADIHGSTPNLLVLDNTIRSKMDAFGLFTGQVGASVTDRNYQFITTSTGALISSTGYQTRWGGTAGVGLEYGFAPNWSVAVEYDHIFESRHSTTFTTPAGALSAPFTTGGDTDLITARVNWRFGGPVIAKY
jgi:outer membrane immunogenic protein